MPQWNQNQPTTRLTRPHQKLRRAILQCGFSVEDEFQIGPYRVDCYVREVHLAFEADGPYHKRAHQKRHDAERDEWLMENAGLPVIRFPMNEINKYDELVRSISPLIEEWACNIEERRSIMHAMIGHL